mmetsp:Transcript_15139/g.32651  ORF Transcript_15139/g.32651 Transcript_15139/m.32651 type:complete len:414 (-) Transcript_15139:87-1328(-)|eukprot:CAMPEP_0206583886 /NCGR_PEP_ID=MMETSP0325_2-20121206/35380_1 /ASSEMBLY_ACC=CAM_ASM_000347 /TAXON_ID=2866 /ORGANISM="Crypthecodinium cohnii, Strain Seligo" /LENGTH=413 /DNA_ID=CAMNT_0054090911 /DNA_START=67 /DNA_END=1308 /DNA_ORIENTATION=+
MGVVERIKAIEEEMARTQKNKATEGHLGSLKAKLAALRRELMEPEGKAGGKQPGFEVQRYGDSRVALMGFPSVGKSSLLTALTGVESEAAAYEFTTLTCIPGVIYYNDAKIQLLDLPGIIKGAASGKGRGRQVIATARSADVIIMVLDATKDDSQKQLLTKELEDVGIRLNKRPPKISVTRTKTGGFKFNATVPLTRLSKEVCFQILQQYKQYNLDVVVHEDATVDDFIDVLEESGSMARKYMRCIYVYNKIDMLTPAQVDILARREMAVVISVNKKWGLDGLLERLWQELELVRIYTKKKGLFPDFKDPLIMTPQRGNKQCTIENAVGMLHKSLLEEFKSALVWGASAKSSPMVAGLKHVLADEDVIQIQKLTAAERHRKTQGKKTGTTLAGTNTVDAAASKRTEKKAPLKT